MKVLSNLFQFEQFSSTELISSQSVAPRKENVEKRFRPNLNIEDILTKEARVEMEFNTIPDLKKVCIDLYQTSFVEAAPSLATRFIPVLKSMEDIRPTALNIFECNQKTNHVLIENSLLKVVLIHWEPGKISSIHGHPSGGGVFKVLKGSVEELRYTSSNSPQLLASSTYQKDAIGYIDDQLGLHAVGNPFNTSAVTLHAYTRGVK